MKKYFVEQNIEFVETDRRGEARDCYECNGFEFAKNWAGNCIRLLEVNTVKEVKGREVRKERKTAVYVTTDTMSHWETNKVIVTDAETGEIVYSNK